MNLQLLLRNFRPAVLSFFAIFIGMHSNAQIINTIAGTGTASYGGDGGTATSAYFYNPNYVTTDHSGNIYICDELNNRIRKITISTGIVTTIAGNGTAGYSGDGGAAISAELNTPTCVVLDAAGNFYICDYLNSRIRKVTVSSGIITTIAGNGTAGFSGDGGAATAAEINEPTRILVDPSGNLFIGDRNNYRVRKVNTSGVISTFAGNGSASYSGDGGAATAAAVDVIYGMLMDPSGNLYMTDLFNSRVRMVNTSGVISTFAGNGSSSHSGDGGPATAAGVYGPEALAIDESGNIYIGDNATGYGDDYIRKVTPAGIISTFAGNGTYGFSGDGGPATSAEFYSPQGICYDSTLNCLYVTDFYNNRVRKISMTNHPPHFTRGPSQTLTVCENTTGNSINSLLPVLDTDAGQTETWSIAMYPPNGTLSGFTTVGTSTGGTITPTGLSYSPTYGYTGTDSFRIRVSDGVASDTITIYVTVNPLPDAGTVAGSATVCVGMTTTYSDGSSGGTWSSASSSIATVVSTTGVVSGVAVGSTYITYTVTNSCGSSYVAASLTVLATPSAGTISGASAICATASATLTDGAAGGSWSLSNANASLAGSTVTGTTAGFDTVYYSVTNSCGTAVASHVMTINVMPVAITGTMSVCAGGGVTNLRETVGGGTWSSSATGTATVDASGNVYGVSSGTVNISYIITSTGCGVGTSVTVNPLPSAIGGPTAVCQGSTITLTNTSGGGTWTSANTSVATIATGTATTGILTGVSNGTALISYALGTGCQVTTNITVNSLPDAITGATAVCVGSIIGLADGSGGGTWSSSNAGQATVSSSGVVGGVASGTPNITYTITGGCYMTYPITVNPLPSAISGATSVCTGLTATVTDGGFGNWASSNTAMATVDATGVVYGVTAGTVTITYTLGTSCYTTSSFTVNQSPSAIGGATSVCAGGSTATVTDTEPGGTWASANTAIATITGGGFVTGVAAGTVTISYTISGCPATTSFTVNALPGAIISPMGDTMLCPGDMVMLTGSTGTRYLYQWFSGATSISGATNEYYETTTAANYSFQVTNTYGCTSVSVPMSVTVNPASASISYSGATTFCAGTAGSLDASASGGYSYQWLLDGAGIAGATTAIFNAGATGTYNVVVSNLAGCTATSSSVALTVIPGPTNTLTLSGALTFCTGDSVVITGDTTSGLTYQWLSGGSPIAGATNNHYTATITGNYQLTETNGHPCSSTSAVASVNEIPLPNATVSTAGSSAFCTGNSVTLNAATGSAGTTYQWYKNGTIISGAVSSGYVTSTGGYFAVSVTSPAGCNNITHPAFQVTEVTIPTIIPYTTTSFCWGGSALLGLDVSSSTGVTYQWQKGGLNIIGATSHSYDATSTGAYSCVVTITGSCTIASYATTVTEFPLPDPIISYDGTTLTTGLSYIHYQWYRNSVLISSANGANFVPNVIGDYTVKVTDSNGCQSVSNVYIVRSVGDAKSLSINNLEVGEISIYPNPAHYAIHIAATQQLKAVINAIDGRKVMEQENATDMDISSLADGVYMILLFDSEGRMVKADKLVKN